MIPSKVEIENFKSYGRATVDFSIYDPREPILVIGDNRDTEGADSNGSGKTTLMDAISWAIFGKTPTSTKITQDELIRSNTEQCCVKLWLVEGDSTIIITRGRGKRNYIDLSINGEIKTRSTDTLTQRAILELLGIAEDNKFFYSDFLNTVYYSMDSVKAFTSKTTSSADRMATIARFLNLSVLDKCSNRASSIKDGVKSRADNLSGQIAYLEGAIKDRMSTEQMDAEARKVKDDKKSLEIKLSELDARLVKAQEKSKLEASLEETENQIILASKQKEEYLASLKATFDRRQQDLEQMGAIEEQLHLVEAELESLPFEGDLSKQLLETDNLILSAQDKYNQLNIILKSKEKEVAYLDGQIDKALSCPICGSALQVDLQGGISILDYTSLHKQKSIVINSIKSLASEMEELYSQTSELQNKKKSIEVEKAKTRSLRDTIIHLRDKLSRRPSIEEEMQSILNKKTLKESSTDTLIQSLKKRKLGLAIELKKLDKIDTTNIAALKAEANQSRMIIGQYTADLARLESMKKMAKLDIQKLDKLKDDLKLVSLDLGGLIFWEEGFQVIRRNIIDSFLPEFENRTNMFLTRMKSGLTIQLDTLKAKKSSTKGDPYMEKFDITIRETSGRERSLETFSKGESSRIGIGVGFALRELTLDKGYNVFDFLMMDEVVDGLDSTGIDQFFALLQDVSGLKLIISHDSDLKNKFTNIINVIKENNVSTIAQGVS